MCNYLLSFRWDLMFICATRNPLPKAPTLPTSRPCWVATRLTTQPSRRCWSACPCSVCLSAPASRAGQRGRDRRSRSSQFSCSQWSNGTRCVFIGCLRGCFLIVAGHIMVLIRVNGYQGTAVTMQSLECVNCLPAVIRCVDMFLRRRRSIVTDARSAESAGLQE